MNNSCPHCRAVFDFDGLVGYVENRNEREMREGGGCDFIQFYIFPCICLDLS